MLQIIGSILGAILGANAANDAAEKALEIGNANADDLLAASRINANEVIRIAKLNGEAILDTANLNAESIWRVGEANALAQIEAGIENIGLVETETLEVLRRHKLRTVQNASDMRAATGASGVRVGQGSPLAVLTEHVNQGFIEQTYMGNLGKLRLEKIGNEAARRGQLTWLSAKERGEVMVSTALLQRTLINEEAESRASGMMRDARLNAASLRRGGSLLAMNYRNQATANLISGFTNAFAYMQ